MPPPIKKWRAPPGFRLVLASGSPRRARLLRKAGIDFDVVVPKVDEKEGAELPHLTAAELALNNASLKARVVSARHPESWVLGADTVVVFEGRTIGKPTTMKEAREIFDLLNGKTHRVITAVFFIRERPFHQMPFYDVSHVTFNRLTARERDEYLKAINPLDKAGAYSAQEQTEKLIEKVEGSFSNVVGLPIERLIEVLDRVSRHSSGMLRKPGKLGWPVSRGVRNPYSMRSIL
jgi:septum formation protein